MNPSILEQIFGAPGYCTDFSISAAELALLRQAISIQWMARIEQQHPEHAAQFRAAGLAQYHLHSHLICHETLWPKESRVLPKDAVENVKQSDFMQRLSHAFGASCEIANVTFFSGTIPDYPEVYWRLVRPQAASDVGALHADKWFHNILGQGKNLFRDDQTSIKMWLAVFAEPGRNGLYVVPGSHQKQWQLKHSTGADGYARPALDEALGSYRKELLNVVPGQAVLFNENLLHGGALNLGASCRVSVEITFLLTRAPPPQPPITG